VLQLGSGRRSHRRSVCGPSDAWRTEGEGAQRSRCGTLRRALCLLTGDGGGGGNTLEEAWCACNLEQRRSARKRRSSSKTGEGLGLRAVKLHGLLPAPCRSSLCSALAADFERAVCALMWLCYSARLRPRVPHAHEAIGWEEVAWGGRVRVGSSVDVGVGPISLAILCLCCCSSQYCQCERTAGRIFCFHASPCRCWGSYP